MCAGITYEGGKDSLYPGLEKTEGEENKKKRGEQRKYLKSSCPIEDAKEILYWGRKRESHFTQKREGGRGMKNFELNASAVSEKLRSI